jgi:hypothetical protein
MVGWILRFCCNQTHKDKQKKGVLTGEEMLEAETRLLKCIQMQNFFQDKEAKVTKESF